MTAHPSKCLLAHRWLCAPAVSFPIGGAVIKLVGGSTRAAVAVGAAPYVMYALLRLVRVIGHLVAAIYLGSEAEGQEAMERRITLSANAVVSILTLRPRTSGRSAGPRNRTTPRPRHRKTT